MEKLSDIQRAARVISLRNKLQKIESQLDRCRTSAIEDGWQTQKHSKKARKWDYYAEAPVLGKLSPTGLGKQHNKFIIVI